MMKQSYFFAAKGTRARVAAGVAMMLVAWQAPGAFAWSEGGHMAVASIAYGELTPGAKAKVDALLGQHPDAATWTQEHAATDPAMGQYLFMRASLWPDEIRRTGNAFDHPNWHFVDYPLAAPFQQVPDDIASPYPDDDVLFGIATSEDTLKADAALTPARAASLSWLVHLVGDIHQPLHCATLIEAPDFSAPKGDLGGNSLYVAADGKTMKLHTYWDRLLSDPDIPYQPRASHEVKLANQEKEIQFADQEVVDLLTRFPRTALAGELTTRNTVRDWSLDSSRLALADAYLNGQLAVSTDAQQGTTLDADYETRAKTVADRQVALAGYRLADEINRLFPD